MQAKSVLLVALSVTGCASPSGESELVREEPVTAVASPTLSSEARLVLEAAAVTHDSYARGVFYTWASDAGIARMHAEKRLILPTEQEGYFVQQIDALAASGNGPTAEIARLLATHPSLSARRYAWTRPFATRVPLAEVGYGDHLVRAVLKPEAIIARFDSRDVVPFRFVDLDGEEVPLGRVLADPSTLAAVYHVAVHPQSGEPFREFVLCNESMIAEWSMGTKELAEVIAEDLRAVRSLASAGLPNVPASTKWEHRGATAEETYAAALAFDTKRHRPTRDNLLAMASLLEDAAQSPPLVVTPAVKFVVTSATPPPVPALPKVRVISKKYVCS